MVQYFGVQVAQARQFHLARGFASPCARLYPVFQCYDGQTFSMDLRTETRMVKKSERVALPAVINLPCARPRLAFPHAIAHTQSKVGSGGGGKNRYGLEEPAGISQGICESGTRASQYLPGHGESHSPPTDHGSHAAE